MAAPYDADAVRPEACDHAGGLGVVEQHEVAGVGQAEHLGHVGPDDPFVAGVLAGAEAPAVARIAVQQVVHTLRDGEELRFPVEDEPPVVDPRSSPVRQQCLQHLGHPAAMGCRVDMPDRAVPERRARSCRGLGRAPSVLRRQNARQQFERERLDFDLVHADILTCIRSRSRHIDRPPGEQFFASVTIGPIRIERELRR